MFRRVSDREILEWAEVGPATRALAEAVHADGWEPDVILAIARGGLLVAGALGYALGVPVPDLVDLEHSRVLIADDVADTGLTLQTVHDFCGERVGEVRSAVLYEKSRSGVRCDYVWRRTASWGVFPWSAQPPVGAVSTTEA